MPSPTLHLRFKKTPDGATTLSCTRPDGTVTWQRTPAAHASFFARHDLTHYAVETVLHHKLGFFGLIASGWDFTDFDSSWPKGKIPAHADPAELIVGFFDAQRTSNSNWSAEEFNQHAAQFYGPQAAHAAPTLTEDQLTAIRTHLNDLINQWDNLPPGEALELSFSPT